MKFPPIREAWMYDDPGEHADALIARTARQDRALQTSAPAHPAAAMRDRYYTQARRLHVKQLMKGRR